MPQDPLTIDRTVIPITTARARPSRRPGRGGGAWPPRADPRECGAGGGPGGAAGGGRAPVWRRWGWINGYAVEFAASPTPPPSPSPEWVQAADGTWVGFRLAGSCAIGDAQAKLYAFAANACNQTASGASSAAANR